MASDVLSQTFFGIYEFFANIIPGTLLLTTILLITNHPFPFQDNLIVDESLSIILFAFIAFILGVAIQGISSFIEKVVNKKKYGNYPSSLYLMEKNETFPPYFQKRIKELVNKKFGTPINAPTSHIFDLCYTYVMQKKISERVPQFLRAYTFARNMIVVMIIESSLSFYYAYSQQQIWFIFVGIGFIGLSLIFYTRFRRYGSSFAKEVLRSFLVNEEQKETLK